MKIARGPSFSSYSLKLGKFQGYRALRIWWIFLCVLIQISSAIGEDSEENRMDGQTEEQVARRVLEYEKCDARMRTEQPPDDGYLYCNMTFDSWDCWNYTRASETTMQPCPAWIPDSDPLELASKTCLPSGEWFRHPSTNDTWTNYTECHFKSDSANNIQIVYYMGYGLSVFSLCIAIFIFFYFKSLGCPRVTIHKNLFISFILCGTVWIHWFALVTQNPKLIMENPPICKVLLVLGQYFNTCNYFWMLSEGLYLHTVIVVAVFSENHRLHWYYIIGWVLPAIPVGIYTGFLVHHDPGLCWLEENSYEWWFASFILLVLVVNLGLLLNIVRVLLTKLRATPNSGSGRNYTRAVRATLILLPLLGLHYIILPVRPSENTIAELLYNYFMAILLAFQGFFVACIFCFFNGEVKMQIRRKWYSYRWGRRGSTFGGRYGNMNTTITETVSTVTPNDRRSIDKGQNSPLLNKAPSPVPNSLGNGKTLQREVAADVDETTREAAEESSCLSPGAREVYSLENNNSSWDCNANTERQDVCPSILIEDHDEQASKTTEV